MFARFKPPQKQQAAPGISGPIPSSPSDKNGSAVLIQRLIILHDGLIPLYDEEGSDEVDASKDTIIRETKQKVRRRNPQAVLSEDASLEEHGEFILYYYNHSLHANRGKCEDRQLKRGNNPGGRSRSSSISESGSDQDHCAEEAVKFAGLCRALRLLPLSLHPQNSAVYTSQSEDETEVAHLSDSTMVFVPLELNGDVFAVVQIPRATDQQKCFSQHRNNPYQPSGKSCIGYGADPVAIRNAVRHCHLLFSMLYGGGVHKRLLKTKHIEKNDDWFVEERGSLSDLSISLNVKLSSSFSQAATYRYGGMKELFELRREHRKLNSSNDGGQLLGRSSWRRKSNPLDSFEDIADQMGRIACQDKIDSLLQILPITFLKRDIKAYYDDWLEKMEGMCAAIKGGVGRSVVEMIPKPIQQNAARGQHPPNSPAPFMCLSAAEFLGSLLQEKFRTTSNTFQLAGVSFFYQNSYVLSKFLQSTDAVLSPETVCMIVQYLKSRQQKEPCRDQKQSSTPAMSKNENTASIHNPLDRWLSTISVGSGRSDSARSSSSILNTITQSPSFDSCEITTGYIAPHPHDNEQAVDSIFVSDLKCEVWLPCVYLPSMIDQSDDDHTTATPVTLFAHEDYAFLLFFRGMYSDKKSASELLSSIQSRLSRFCGENSPNENSVVESSAKGYQHILDRSLFNGEPGKDIIFVDRENNKFILLSQRDLATNNFHRKTNTTSQSNNAAKGIFGLGFKIKENCDREHDTPSFSESSAYVNMLDCRHKLASYLPLDVMLAFDDLFNEIGQMNCRQNILEEPPLISDVAQDKSTSNRNRTIELCTYLPQGWVYGRACESLELYVLLDTSKFVTISDVTKAVTRVHERLLNDKMN